MIMDEPSATVTDREIRTLFAVIADLKSRGVGVVYISHRLDEIFDLADRVAVLRDGALIRVLSTKDVSREMLIMLMVGVCGPFNGFFVTKFDIPPFVTSLAVMTAGRGLSYIICGGLPVWNLPEGFSWVGRGVLFGIIPVPVIIMFALMIAGHIFLSQTRYGRYIYAVGGNAEECVYLDFGAVTSLRSVTVYWGANYAASYDIQVSNDARTGETVAVASGAADSAVETKFDITEGRYLRILCLSGTRRRSWKWW
jgi:hypothetical protein